MSESTTNDPTSGEASARDQGEPDGQKWLSGIVSVIGLWIAVSPTMYETAASITWNNTLVGGAIFLLAGYNFYRIVAGHPTSTGVLSLVTLLALWTVVAPFAFEGQFAMADLGVASEGLVWSNVVSGLIAAGLAAYIAYAAGSDVQTGTPAETR
ncbi:SPW repeat domain-containing protein [Natronorubrum daqingense]|uniref:SPW repeat-containing protein n=1 Tax=Natronorubrum daqingense TaxID=588898 RepID=A0A1N6YIK2_9EURY|nr:SPW repeat protein [Natronorubrum daqingense]APX95655.1 hypothetical protein BB347_02955 [Natronorubrum daqingense]SIR14398.1 SPW repeat-containing protein [Natronorubrum daqingense]